MQQNKGGSGSGIKVSMQCLTEMTFEQMTEGSNAVESRRFV
jgi:hypothetical protein